MVAQILKGTWEEIRAHDADLVGKHVELVVFAEEKPNGVKRAAPAPNGLMYFGMFAGSGTVTEEDLKSAEFHGDTDDGLDWP
jgi:hypothetical protein